MTRPLKFRIWDKATNRMLTAINALDYVLCADGRPYNVARDGYCDDEVVVMVWTGLLDATGRAIYEGDVVERVIRRLYQGMPMSPQIDRALVVWNEHGWDPFIRYAPVRVSLTGTLFSDGSWNAGHGGVWVIGNRWEQPELVGEKDTATT